MINFSGCDAHCFFNGVYNNACLLVEVGTKTSTIIFTANNDSLELLKDEKKLILELILINNEGHSGYIYADLYLDGYSFEANVDSLNCEFRVSFNSKIVVIEGFGKEFSEATAARVAALKSKNNI